MLRVRGLMVPVVVWLAGCVQSAELGSDCDMDGGCRRGDASAHAQVGYSLPVAPEPLSGIRSLDLLIVVDASPGAAAYQQAFAGKVPALLEQLQRGELDGGGFPEFRPLTRVRAGVVAANRGVSSLQAPGCEPFDARVLTTRNVAAECMGAHQELIMTEEAGDAAFAHELACAVQLGESACGVSQPLQAVVEGLSALRLAQGGVWLEDSARLVVILSAQEDCSTTDADLFAPDATLGGGDPLLGWPDTLRCVASPSRLTTTSVYVDALGVPAGQASRLMLLVLAGFPAERVGAEAYEASPSGHGATSERFYGELLGDPRMSYGSIVGPTSRLGNACAGTAYSALPARRLAQVAQQLGPYARVGSLCGELDVPLHGLMRLVASTVGLAGL